MSDIEKYNPISVITKIQKIKYKFALIPIILVVLSFISGKYLGEEISKYFALTGLILYLAITFLFKINYRYRMAEGVEAQFVFPISGKVIGKEENYLIIKKNPFFLADIRYSGENFVNDDIVGKKYIFFEGKAVAGQLIGVVPFSATYKIAIPNDKIERYSIGAKVNAGDIVE